MKKTVLSALALTLLSAHAFTQNERRETNVHVDSKLFYGCRKVICEKGPETKNDITKTSVPEEKTSKILPRAKALDVILQCAGSTDNRSGLAWNPEKKLYYSVNAGNSSYPIETFSADGEKLNSVSQGFDYRGLWWNPNTNSLEGNGYYSCGYSTQKLDEKGYAIGSTVNFIYGYKQPNEQSCATYNPVTNEIINYSEGKLFFYSHSDGDLLRTVEIKKLPASVDQIGITSCVYTGQPGMEIGIYDFNKRAVYFIDLRTVTYAGTSLLPSDSHNPNRFRIAYCNDMLWMFDAPSMKWMNYRVFDKQLLPEEPETIVVTVDTLQDVPPPVLLEDVNIENGPIADTLVQYVLMPLPLTCGLGSLFEEAPAPIELLEEPAPVEETQVVEEVLLSGPVEEVPVIVEEVKPITGINYIPQNFCCYTLSICEFLPVVTEEPVVIEPVVTEPIVLKEMNAPVETPLIAVIHYPNPVADQATVTITGFDEFEGTFTLYGNAGQVVKQVQVNSTQFTVERDGLASGVYFYQVSSSDGVVGTGKMVLQK